MFWVWFLTAVAVASPSSPSSPSSPPAAAELVARVQRVYRQGGNLTAAFEQVRYDQLRPQPRRQSGRLWVKQDGRVRWNYEKPEPKDFVYDGKAAYFYEPLDAQVIVFERFSDSPLSQAMRFLWGVGDLGQAFELGPCQADTCPADVGPAETAVRLTPKEPIASVDHISLVIDGERNRVTRSVVYDPLGNRTEYRFTEVAFGAAIADSKFAFKIPAGVNVVRSTDPAVSTEGGGS